jgi:SAM-dependent methyltransferase
MTLTNALTLTFASSLAQHRHVLWSSSVEPPLQLAGFVGEYVQVLPVALFNQALAPLKLGRFYPAQILDTREAMPAPLFRVVGLAGGDFTADFNHPLAGQACTPGSEAAIEYPCGSASPAELLRWAGLDTPLRTGEVDYSDADAFEREDKALDAAFYATPRKVMHMDSVCAQRLAAFYRAQLPAGGAVLDLMAGWRSHLPAQAGAVTGLGMNAEEMADNPQLQTVVQHDLNTLPELPFAEASFAAVVNTVSVEYLTQPLRVLQEVRRVLQPGGTLLLTFSNRFFPPKAIMLWKRLHPVERVNWVVQLLHAAGFADIHILVERGLKRDTGDRYYPQLKEMDPLFAISAHA